MCNYLNASMQLNTNVIFFQLFTKYYIFYFDTIFCFKKAGCVVTNINNTFITTTIIRTTALGIGARRR